MSFHRQVVSASRNEFSTPSDAYGQAYGSPASASSWGTLSTNVPLPKNLSSPSTYSFGLDSPSHQGHFRLAQNATSPRRDSHSEDLYSRSSIASFPGAGSSGLLPQSGPAQPSTSIALIPTLSIHSEVQQRVNLDLSRAPSLSPSTYNYHPSMSSSAFHPSMTYTDITIHGPVKWSFRIHTPHALTVYDVLNQLYHYLQGSDGRHDGLSSRMKPTQMSVGDYRNQNPQRGLYGDGVKRLDLLGPRHFLAGLDSAPGDNAWNVYLSTSS
ncbi:hypothetical protein CPB83DRAFT_236387 [Crepidotus variabilis]|uniref:DUF6699 domain-containing protein n=1 Tax=Crepidotus variabilis TaxID=179855 RepID=A0A9P6JRR8_9AGAR|nr:hypothetical protein CPB83DRAFT_236387 [Crepidotus variabilis]